MLSTLAATIRRSSIDAAAAGPPARVTGLPIVGLMPALLMDPLQTIVDVVRRHGDAVRVRIGPMDFHVLAHPDHAQHVLVDRARIYTKDGGPWEAARRLVGNGIGTADGEPWLRQRRAMQPHFQRSSFGGIASIMSAAIQAELGPLGARAGRPLSLFDELRRMSARVFLRTMFDASIDDGDIDALLQATKESFASIDTMLWTYSLPPWMPVPGMARYKAAVEKVDAIVYRILDHRLAHPSSKDDLLNLLLRSFPITPGDAAGRLQIRDEIATLLVAAHDTSATMLGWALSILGQRPEVEAAVRREAAEVLGGRAPSFSDVARLGYTRAVLEESLRLYPPLWLTARQAAEDDVVDGHRVPRGSFVLLIPYLIHRHPAFWRDPEAFDPARFLEENAAPIPRGAYLPFGMGPHQCIGKYFGLMLGQMFLAEIVQRFRVHLAPGTRLEAKGMISLQPRREIMAELEAIPFVLRGR